MQLGSPKDAIATFLVWTPILAVVLGVAMLLYGGLGQLEARTDGSSFVVSNAPEAHPWAAVKDHRANGQGIAAVGIG